MTLRRTLVDFAYLTAQTPRLLARCLSSDSRRFRTRLFVGTANLLPGFMIIDVFIRPLLLRLAGARVQYPVMICRPLYITYAPDLSIARYTFINEGLRVEGWSRVTIGEAALIGPFCCIENTNHRGESLEHLPVTIGARAWIGAGSILLPGVTVGDEAVVAAGAVVRGNVPGCELWAGVPARFVRKLEPFQARGVSS